MVDQLESFILSKEEFRDFLKILNYTSCMCEDLHVVGGKILQRIDTNVAIIKCDLSNLLQLNGAVVFYSIAKIIKNLRGLNKGGPIRFRRLENSLLVKDTITSILISLGDEKYCDNKKMPEAEFDEIVKLGEMFLECEIDKSLCNSLNSFSKLSNQHAVRLRIRSGTPVFGYGEAGSTGIRSEFRVNHKLKENMFDCEIILPAIIFSTKSETTLRVYFDEKNCQTDSMAICIFNFLINENMAFEIYCRSNIMRKQEE